ncbi:helix-turn-helix transcriptional regulator [Vibrio sp. SM6]|uniref:Helix-turn-helix transcriptional regulator n=1 Tax=Vibrio agarilyticus TaxID=2726741 RepID=A0A7X8TNH6_9VIBR|nr:LuxR C-terminal-related transcriptional regulator [Vibrio agarilyticus]NLS11746.1 helix-turn-helix transcriptional regulator [Vibrio agarilyticus]
MATAATRVVLIADDSLQSILLKDKLEQVLGAEFVLFTPQQLVTATTLPARCRWILFDHDLAQASFYSHYVSLLHRAEHPVQEILFNCAHSVGSETLAHWQNVVGLFYFDDSIEHLQQGIARILSGEMWFSRRLASELIEGLRLHRKPVSSHDMVPLTKRERQIITLLSNGDSNQQIARTLSVSENTVKTHLHNIFRKIDVRNRVQALIWAKDHLSFHQGLS